MTLYIVCLSLPKRKHHKDKDLSALFMAVFPVPRKFLASGRYSGNICWMNECKLKKILSFHMQKKKSIPSQRTESFEEILAALNSYILLNIQESAYFPKTTMKTKRIFQRTVFGKSIRTLFVHSSTTSLKRRPYNSHFHKKDKMYLGLKNCLKNYRRMSSF